MPFDFLWHKPTPERMLGPEPTQVTSPCKFGTSGTNKTSPVVFYWLFVNWQQEFKWQKRGHLPSPSINKACFPTGSRGHRQCLGKTAEASRQQPQGIRAPHRLGFGPHRPAHSLPTPRAQKAASDREGDRPHERCDPAAPATHPTPLKSFSFPQISNESCPLLPSVVTCGGLAQDP